MSDETIKFWLERPEDGWLAGQTYGHTDIHTDELVTIWTSGQKPLPKKHAEGPSCVAETHSLVSLWFPWSCPTLPSWHCSSSLPLRQSGCPSQTLDSEMHVLSSWHWNVALQTVWGHRNGAGRRESEEPAGTLRCR